MDARELMLAGFLVYPRGSAGFAMRKEPVPGNPLVLPEQEYRTYDEAVAAASEKLAAPPALPWSVTVRYDRGLGVEYRSLPEVIHSSRAEAELAGEAAAREEFGEAVRQVMVRPKLLCDAST